MSITAHTKKWIWIFFGFTSLTLGFVGAFLPLLPTTPFLLLAAYCFSKSSAELHRWLLSLKGVGPLIKKWERDRRIPIRVKFWAIFMMLLGVAISWSQMPPLLIARITLLVLAGMGVIYIVRQKS